MRDAPTYELREMAQLLEHEGITGPDAQLIATTLARYPHAYEKTMVEKELAIPLDPETTKHIAEALDAAPKRAVGQGLAWIDERGFAGATGVPLKDISCEIVGAWDAVARPDVGFRRRRKRSGSAHNRSSQREKVEKAPLAAKARNR